ncbi:dynamin family protein [Microbispora sp. H11081]|uniref:dynamin family protein n=1 Tax=Microbispora sp. H11081 TaxID=2729107 RepID=UPI0014741D2F|nr:dynamin family protein [Microbispora sp. H11081]
MTTSPSDRLKELCAATSAKLADQTLRDRLAQVTARLDAPLKVAVAGAVSSGKSTLVNALLGYPVALVAPGECTPFVTQYEYGADHGRVDVEYRDGGASVHRLEPGDRLPADLGAPANRIARVRVQLSAPALRTITVVDTPGMNTITARNERAARQLLFGTTEDDNRAQALIYVLRYLQRFDDEILTEFRGLTDACGMTCVNTLAVLSQVDRRGDEEDPWPTARRLAAKAYEQLSTAVFDVVPLIGLLAESARTSTLGPEELAGLRALAALDDRELDYLLLDLGYFAESPTPPVPADVRRHLLRRLHRYGIRAAVSAIRSGQVTSLETLRRTLLEHSGFDATTSSGTGTVAAGTVAAGLAHFARRADHLKSMDAIGQLKRLAQAPALGLDRTVLDALAAELDEARPIAADLGELRIFAAMEAVGRGKLVLSGEMQAELLQLARSDDPTEQLGLPSGASRAEVSAAAVSAAARWRGLAMMANGRAARERAHEVMQVLENLASSPGGRAEAAPTVHPRVPALPVDAEAVRRLLASPLLPAEDRGALDRLTSGADAAAQVGAPAGATPFDVAALAAALSARFRMLKQRPLPLTVRRAAETICDVYAAISFVFREGEQGATTHADDR